MWICFCFLCLFVFWPGQADVINRGFSGYNTKWIRDILPQIFPESSSSSTSHPLLPVEFVTVLLGSNDCVTEGEPQHVSLGDFARNLLQIVNWIHEHASQRVILMSPPPVNSEKWGNRSCRRLQHYAAVVEEISRRTNCVFLDLYQEMASHEGGFNSLLSDGLHLNEEGNRVVFKALQRRIQEKYPHITELTMDQPDWKQLAGISPES